MSQSDDMQEADLGLGDGLKPGGLTILSSEPQNSDESHLLSKVSYNSDGNNHSGCSCSEGSEDEFELTLMPIQQIHDLKTQYSYLVPKHSSRSCETFSDKNEENLIYDDRYFGPKSSEKSTCEENSYRDTGKDSNNDDRKPEFPTYADVSYGTSIRQQKELFNQNIEEIRKKMNVSLSNTNNSPEKERVKAENHKPRKKRTCEEIAMKLAETLQEVEDLKTELDTCEQRLESKYKAIDILRKQAEEAQKQLRFTERTSKETSLKLSQEICELQFQVERQENSILDSQEVWAHRFDRLM
ncbi:coiled-coil domain-containing protein 125-like isoform X2 [Ruditapes philippinarum]|uniref:coiled-coil domain-containing protein 125-like isoform X2 n=1 Tax=Ruditapes philippinarum TaxID=129788 RepID=UPI00295BD5D8|nr:coiled-coil domain-containing protein 125-like isoform X2 [Ruditapes philippinarum]